LVAVDVEPLYAAEATARMEAGVKARPSGL
jgi:hypothetical protein